MPERTMPRGANVTGLRRGKILETDEAGPFVYDVDAEGRVLGIEILHASKMLAPGDWQKARLPGTAADAAEEGSPSQVRPRESAIDGTTKFGRISQRTLVGVVGG